MDERNALIHMEALKDKQERVMKEIKGKSEVVNGTRL